jgi:hypothetical protein
MQSAPTSEPRRHACQVPLHRCASCSIQHVRQDRSAYGVIRSLIGLCLSNPSNPSNAQLASTVPPTVVVPYCPWTCPNTCKRRCGSRWLAAKSSRSPMCSFSPGDQSSCPNGGPWVINTSVSMGILHQCLMREAEEAMPNAPFIMGMAGDPQNLNPSISTPSL